MEEEGRFKIIVKHTKTDMVCPLEITDLLWETVDSEENAIQLFGRMLLLSMRKVKPKVKAP